MKYFHIATLFVATFLFGYQTRVLVELYEPEVETNTIKYYDYIKTVAFITCVDVGFKFSKTENEINHFDKECAKSSLKHSEMFKDE